MPYSAATNRREVLPTPEPDHFHIGLNIDKSDKLELLNKEIGELEEVRALLNPRMPRDVAETMKVDYKLALLKGIRDGNGICDATAVQDEFRQKAHFSPAVFALALHEIQAWTIANGAEDVDLDFDKPPELEDLDKIA